MLRIIKLIAALCGLLAILTVACASREDAPIPTLEPATVTPDIVSQPIRAQIAITAIPTIASVTPYIATISPTTPPPTATRHPATPTPTISVNGVPLTRFVVLSNTARQHIRQVFAQGQTLGRNPRAFSKIGDSTMVYPPFLAAFDGKVYKLGAFNSLQPTIDRFVGSFARESIAARKGMHTWSEFDPTWVNSNRCQSDEGPLECELRVNNPSIALIRLGANDYYAPLDFNTQLRKIVETCLAYGVIPVLSTKPDRMEGQANTLNKTVAQVASAYAVPLWDYDLIVATIPGKGLEKDGVHFIGSVSRDYSSKQTLKNGDALQDLTGLLMLDAIRQELGD